MELYTQLSPRNVAVTDRFSVSFLSSSSRAGNESQTDFRKARTAMVEREETKRDVVRDTKINRDCAV